MLLKALQEMFMNTISIVGSHCVGCRSCEQVCPKKCISIHENEEGFLYPEIAADKCVNCGQCLTHCPAQTVKMHTPMAAYGLKNKNTERIMQSASGGASDLIAQYIVSNHGVVFGCAYTSELEVRHIAVDNSAELHRIQSSKYVQSDTGDCYAQAKEALKAGRTVLFTGTPCQIAGLFAFLGRDYEKLFTLDLICHGVPSPEFLRKYFAYKKRKLGENLLKYNFRSKAHRGWGTQYLIETKTKTKTNLLSLDKYGKHFMSGDCYRECCYQCKFAGTNRVSDITVGDFWGIQKCDPEFFSEKGVSSVIVNTPKGQFLMENISQYADIISCSMDDVLIRQGNLVSPTKRPDARDTFYNNIKEDDFIDRLKVGFCLKDRLKAVLPRKLTALLKRFV